MTKREAVEYMRLAKGISKEVDEKVDVIFGFLKMFDNDEPLPSYLGEPILNLYNDIKDEITKEHFKKRMN